MSSIQGSIFEKSKYQRIKFKNQACSLIESIFQRIPNYLDIKIIYQFQITTKFN